MKRLFLAFNLSDAAREAAVETQTRVKEQFAHSEVSWVAPANFHVTIHFIGNFPEDDIPALITSLRGIEYPPPFDMALTDASAFPNKKKPRVLIVNATFRTEAFGVVTRTAKALAMFGVKTDKRPWKPHVTIGRIKKQAEVLKPETIDVPPASFDIDHFSLYESRPDEQGSVYTELAKFSL